MIMPTKYQREDEVLIGLGASLMRNIPSEISLSELWENSKNMYNVGTYERFILALDMLFIMGLINFEDNKIVRIES